MLKGNLLRFQPLAQHAKLGGLAGTIGTFNYNQFAHFFLSPIL